MASRDVAVRGRPATERPISEPPPPSRGAGVNERGRLERPAIARHHVSVRPPPLPQGRGDPPPLVDRVARGRYAIRQIGLLGTRASSEDVALAVAALDRADSRGAHFRSDFPETGSLEEPRFTSVRLAADGTMALEMKPVEFTIVRPGDSLIEGEAGAPPAAART